MEENNLNEKNNDRWMLPWEQMIHKTEESVEYSYSCNDSDYSYIISFNEIEANDMIKYTVYNYAISRFKSKKTDTRTQIHFCDMGYRTRGYYKANLAGNYYIKKGMDPKEAIEKASGKYGRIDEAVKVIDPREE